MDQLEGIKMKKDYQNILNRVKKDGFAIVKDGRIAREMSKKPKIKKQNFRFANNRRKKESIIYKIPPIA